MTLQRTRNATRSGAAVWFERPDETEIVLGDLYGALRHQRRYGGVIDVTVLRHLALCVRLSRRLEVEDPRVAAYLAAHDLHEAYVIDVPTGLKECLSDYVAIEERWAERVHRAFGLAYPVPEEIRGEVRRVDKRALVVEMYAAGHPRRDHAAEDHGGPPDAFETRCGAFAFGMSDPALWSIVVSALRSAPP